MYFTLHDRNVTLSVTLSLKWLSPSKGLDGNHVISVYQLIFRRFLRELIKTLPINLLSVNFTDLEI